MTEQGKLDRGKKWSVILAKAVFEEDSKSVEWLNSQESILNDIKVYNESLSPKVTTNSKEVKKVK